jgi:hypothetical protein
VSRHHHQRGMGFKAEPAGAFDQLCGVSRKVTDLVAVTTDLPLEAMKLATFRPPVFKDQDGTSTCVAHGIANSAETRLRSLGVNVEPSSVRALYTLTNELLRTNKSDALADDGTYPRVAMKVAAEYGVPLEQDWPLWKPDQRSVNSVTEEVPPDIIMRASSWKLTEQFAITDTNPAAKITSVASAIAAGYPLPIAGDVDEAFLNYSGSGVVGATDQRYIVGGHMTCLLCYRTNPTTKKKEFLLLNSWLNWGMPGGLAWVSEEFVLSMLEVYAFTLTHARAGQVAITGVEPPQGDDKGGTPIIVHGMGFQPGAKVSIGGVPATDVQYVSPDKLMAKTGAAPAMTGASRESGAREIDLTKDEDEQ